MHKDEEKTGGDGSAESKEVGVAEQGGGIGGAGREGGAAR